MGCMTITRDEVRSWPDALSRSKRRAEALGGGATSTWLPQANCSHRGGLGLGMWVVQQVNRGLTLVKWGRVGRITMWKQAEGGLNVRVDFRNGCWVKSEANGWLKWREPIADRPSRAGVEFVDDWTAEGPSETVPHSTLWRVWAGWGNPTSTHRQLFVWSSPCRSQTDRGSSHPPAGTMRESRGAE